MPLILFSRSHFYAMCNISLTYLLQKDKYWRFDDIVNGELLTSAGGDFVRDMFPKVNPDIRAVYQRPDNKVAIFRGKNLVIYFFLDIYHQLVYVTRNQVRNVRRMSRTMKVPTRFWPQEKG